MEPEVTRPPPPPPLPDAPAAPYTPQTAPVTIPDPRPPRRQAFALTPLADVMFQLLIFFMLSSSLAPYALIPLGAPTAPDTRAVDRAEATGGGADTSIIWHVGAGEVRSGQNALPLNVLPQAVDALKAEGLKEILLFTTPLATTQDVATVMEIIQVNNVARVRLIGRPGG